MPGQESLDEALCVNAELFRFMSDLVMRQKRVSRVVRRVVPANDDVALSRVAIFAGTGSSPAFLPGIFRRMVEETEFCFSGRMKLRPMTESFTPERLTATLPGAFILTVVGGIALWFNRSRPT